MRIRSCLVAALIVSLLSASPALAQQRVVSRADLRAAMVDKATTEESQRDTLRAVLRHEAARDVAARYDLDLTRADRAIATLDGQQLASLAASAAFVNDELSGEATTVTLSLTALLLIIIIILLID